MSTPDDRAGPPLARLLRGIQGMTDGPAPDAWFTQIAAHWFNQTVVRIGGQPHRLVEVELYLNSATHPDTFTHSDPFQTTSGRWYFHRFGRAYRGGSYKGLDVTFGPSDAFGGMLIRSMETLPPGTARLIDGPSLCVDHMLRLTGHGTVAELDHEIGQRTVFDSSAPLFVEECERVLEPDLITRSARVGLTLARDTTAQRVRHVMCPYRFLTRPRGVRKGRMLTVLGMHIAGLSTTRICRLTGSPLRAVESHLAHFNEGARDSDWSDYLGAQLDTCKLARLYGAWHRRFGERPA